MKWQTHLTTRLSQLDEKQRYYLLGGILLLIFLLDYFLIMKPQLNALMTLNPKIKLFAQDYQTAQNDIARFEQYQAQVENLKVQRDSVGNKILSREEIPSILDNISRLAARSNIRINQIMPLKDSQEMVLSNDDGKYYALPVLVDARGGYHEIGRFFNLIETDRNLMTIAHFDITASPLGDQLQSARITIRAFIMERSGTGAAS